MADSDMLGLAILNLLENAVKFSAVPNRGPVTLTCALSAGAEGERATLTVSDRGIGIPAGELPTILDAAVRGSNARSIEGSGMGLSLVSRIVRAHEGTIAIDSIEGAGTTVSIHLPLAGPSAHEEEPRGSDPDGDRGYRPEAA